MVGQMGLVINSRIFYTADNTIAFLAMDIHYWG
jgi:hypothetical protein